MADDKQAELARCRQCLSDYVQIRNRDNPQSVISSADIDHSSLLNRLLDGQKLYKYPPPRAMSYPWYDLLDNKTARVWDPSVTRDRQGIILEQTLWNLVEVVTEKEEYVARWPHYALTVRLRADASIHGPIFIATVEENENVLVEKIWEAMPMPKPLAAEDLSV